MDQGNKYIFDLHTLEVKEDEERIAARRKKHKKSRVVSWILLLVIVCVIFAGGFFGVTKIIKTIGNSGGEKNVSSADSNVTESSVETVSEPEPAPIIEEPVISTPEPVVVEPTEEELFEEALKNYIATISLEDKVAGIFLVTPEELTGVKQVTRAGDGTKKALEQYAVGGIIYSSTNMTSQDQFKEMITNTVEYARFPLFLGVDEELGKTSFSKAMKVSETQTARAIGDGGDASIAYLEEEKIARYLTEYGLNLNLGVVADVLIDEDESIMKERSFSSDLNVVSEMTEKVVAALHEYGVVGAVKFFPGQGSTSLDTSSGLASTERTREEMMECEIKSFSLAVEAGADMVVVSHISAPNLTEDNVQCSQSKAVMTDLIRTELGFEDVIVVTDALSKAAISSYYEAGEACITAIKAGADMVMAPGDFETAYREVLEAVNQGIISKERIDDSLYRIYKVKFNGKTSEEVNALVNNQ